MSSFKADQKFVDVIRTVLGSMAQNEVSECTADVDLTELFPGAVSEDTPKVFIKITFEMHGGEESE